VTREERLRFIRRVVRTRDYLASRPDPASLSRLPTREERAEFTRMSDQVGARAGGEWAARQRGLR